MGDKYNPILDITYTKIIDFGHPFILKYNKNESEDGDDSVVGLITCDGQELTDEVVINSSVKCSDYDSIIEYAVTDTDAYHRNRYIVAKITRHKNNVTEISELISSHDLSLGKVHSDSIIMWDCSNGGSGYMLFSRQGRQLSDGKYLNIIKHVNTGDYIGVNYISIGNKSRGPRRSFDIIGSNGEMKEKDIGVTDEFMDKYSIPMAVLYRRGVTSVEIKEETGNRKLMVDGSVDYFYTHTLNK